VLVLKKNSVRFENSLKKSVRNKKIRALLVQPFLVKQEKDGSVSRSGALLISPPRHSR